MKNTLTIARRELKSYFDSPTAYIVVIAFLLVAGWMFFNTFFLMGRADMRGFFSTSMSIFAPALMLVLLAPAVTMRLISEERKTGTIELLTTLPVRDREVIAGKFLAALTLLAVALLLTVAYALTVRSVGPLDLGPVWGGYFGMLLFAAGNLAVGLFCSSLTDNQIVAFIIGFFICAALYFVNWLQILLPTAMAPFFQFVSTSYHLDNLARGVLDSRDVLYFLTLTLGGLFLATRSLSRLHA